MESLSDKKIRELARKRVEFRTHLIVFGIINSVIWIIWLTTNRGYPWPVWPLGIWGVGLIFHYIFEYRTSSYLSEEEEYKKLKKKIEEHEEILP